LRSISGFVSGDGSFHLHISKRNSKVSTNVHRKVVLFFSICLHIRDEKVLLSLVDYFKSFEIKAPLFTTQSPTSLDLNKDTKNSPLPIGNAKISKNIHKTEKSVILYFSKFSNIVNIIIPFFDKYSIRGYKKLDFLDFKNVANIVKAKEHLTSEGFNKVEIINSTMNQRRPWS
jgi:hypothetical protein